MSMAVDLSPELNLADLTNFAKDQWSFAFDHMGQEFTNKPYAVASIEKDLPKAFSSVLNDILERAKHREFDPKRQQWLQKGKGSSNTGWGKARASIKVATIPMKRVLRAEGIGELVTENTTVEVLEYCGCSIKLMPRLLSTLNFEPLLRTFPKKTLGCVPFPVIVTTRLFAFFCFRDPDINRHLPLLLGRGTTQNIHPNSKM